MPLTADVKAELMAVRDPRPTARVAELTSLLRFSGGLHSIANRVAVEAELDSDALARRTARDLMELYGVRPELVHVQGSGQRSGSHYAVRVIEGGETLARQTGLLDQRRRPVRGLPNKLTTGSRGDLVRRLARRVPRVRLPERARALRRARDRVPVARGRHGPRRRRPPPGHPRQGARGARRAARRRPRRRGHPRDARRDGREAHAPASGISCASGARCAPAVNRLVNFDDANLRRSAQAAVAACARVERALEILGDEVPDHLKEAGDLRLAHRDASLDELGHHADPPLTKDAVAGRIRRLLAMADKKAEQDGVPDTESAVPVGVED